MCNIYVHMNIYIYMYMYIIVFVHMHMHLCCLNVSFFANADFANVADLAEIFSMQ